jgi:hypothetical protein
MDLVPARSVVVPDDLLVRRQFGNPELVREENIPVREHHGIADLAFARRIVVTPDDLPPPHDEDPALV